ncbi:hypothetical protein FQS96_14340 [Enterococcus faecalis]|uniref:hypothetical protein n=1 Tax=Enterococcus TaxID=1350 RepID=UPI001A96C9F7|nr:hypothetical protein [Enterococcus faecalis]MBO1126617.1 hypothetical protein [Enterococcus faecalis]
MIDEKVKTILLLKEFKVSLEENNHVDAKKICSAVDDAVKIIEKEKTQGIAISVQLANVVKLVNNSLAFNGFKLNSEERISWENLSNFTDKTRISERKGLSILNSIWGSNSN